MLIVNHLFFFFLLRKFVDILTNKMPRSSGSASFEACTKRIFATLESLDPNDPQDLRKANTILTVAQNILGISLRNLSTVRQI